jgi:hypothetical protein
VRICGAHCGREEGRKQSTAFPSIIQARHHERYSDSPPKLSTEPLSSAGSDSRSFVVYRATPIGVPIFRFSAQVVPISSLSISAQLAPNILSGMRA